MAKLFYDHLVLIEEIWTEVDIITIPDHEKKQAKKMVDEYVQQKVITYILDILPMSLHEEFLQKVYATPHDIKHLKFLEEKLDRDIQSDLVKLGADLKKEIRSLLKQHHPQKGKTTHARK